MKKNIKAIALAVGAISVVIYAGMSHEAYQVSSCEAKVTRYVTAEYAETYVDSGIDMEGNFYSSIETDYWSETASEVVTSVTVNDYDVFYPPMPNPWEMPRTNFTRYRQHSDTKLTVHLNQAVDISTFTTNISKNGLCVDNLGSTILVNTFYGITYGSDF